MKQPIISAVALALAFLPWTVRAADDLSSKAEQLVTEAKKVQLEATDIGKELRAKEFALDKVKGMMDRLVEHVQAVDRMTGELVAFESRMSGDQKTRYEAVKVKSQLLNVFANNKKDLLLGPEPAKNRSLLRAKADGIAKRAEMLQQSAMALRR